MHMNHKPPDHSDLLNDHVMKVYALPIDDRETPAKIVSLRSIAQQHQASVETCDKGEDQKIRVVVRGAMRAVVTAAHAIRSTETLKNVFASELLGDHSERSSGSKD